MEREENIRLREEIKAAERSKSALSKQLLEHESLSRDISKESSALQRQLQQKLSRLSLLESDHQDAAQRVNDLTNMLSSYRSMELRDSDLRKQTGAELERVLEERDALMQRMDSLAAEYDRVVHELKLGRALR